MIVLKRLGRFIFIILCLFLFSGCSHKKILQYKEDEYEISFSVPEKENYILSTEISDCVSSLEKAILIGDHIKIGIERDSSLTEYGYSGDFQKYMNAFKKERGFQKVTYASIDGFQRYLEEMNRYEVFLPISNSIILKFNVYSNQKKNKESFPSDVKKILNHMKIQVFS